MKKAILISGAPGTGKTSLAHAIASGHHSVGGYSPTALLRKMPDGTEFVILDEMNSLREVEMYLPLIEGHIYITLPGRNGYTVDPVFIFCSQYLRLPDEQKWRRLFHEIHLESYTLATIPEARELSPEIAAAIRREMAKRQQNQGFRAAVAAFDR